MTLCTAPDVRFNLHECIYNRVGYLRFFSFTVVLRAIGCLLMCQYIKRPKRKRKRKGNRTDKRKKERTKYFEYYSTPSDKYIYIYSIRDYDEHRSLCDPFLFSLYAFSGLLLSVYRCIVRYSSDWKKKAKKRKIARCDASVQYGERKGRRTIFFFFLCLNRRRRKKTSG